MKLNKLSLLLLAALFFAMLSCDSKKEEVNNLNLLIPKPQETTATGKNFLLQQNSSIVISADTLKPIANFLADILRKSTGYQIPVASEASGANIVLALKEDATLGGEGYELNVNEDKVELTAPTVAGLFHGVQTLRQLFPAQVESTSVVQNVTWNVPTGTIKDFPNYAWRGMMLDVARHFFTVSDVKHLLDEMAYYKLNVFHWHLSDDQGWRIEIKSWPKLTEVGGSTQVGGGRGGFYTQEEYKEIVKYAQDRFITVVPEIDMPSHTNAALASYPELNCQVQVIKDVTRKVPQLYDGIEVGFSSLCTNDEKIYKFVDDVIGELAAITPGEYIHIGGDESHSTKKEDYIPFVKHAQEIVAKHGKKVIGWDEIAISTLVSPSTLVQVWAKPDNGKLAIAQGGKVIMSPANRAYLDMSYDSTTKLGLHWAAYVEVDSAYTWNPAAYVPGITRENVYGVEAALWTETIRTRTEMDYMVFPRLPGHAEIAWTTKHETWDEYKVRLGNHAPRFKAMGVDFYPSKKVEWKE